MNKFIYFPSFTAGAMGSSLAKNVKLKNGLSKLNRIVEFYARRPQIQENLTMQVHNHINEVCEENLGVAVVIEADHMCACIRGVKHNGIMKTAKLSGKFKDSDRAREEFYNFIRDLK